VAPLRVPVAVDHVCRMVVDGGAGWGVVGVVTWQSNMGWLGAVLTLNPRVSYEWVVLTWRGCR
jgi:hypothetical protein